MIQTYYANKLAGHISRDSTAIHAREKAIVKPKAPQEPKGKKRGRRVDKLEAGLLRRRRTPDAGHRGEKLASCQLPLAPTFALLSVNPPKPRTSALAAITAPSPNTLLCALCDLCG